MNDLEEIIKYVDHELKDEEIKAFEQKLVNDSSLLDKVHLFQEVNSALEDERYYDFLHKLKKIQIAYQDTDSKRKDPELVIMPPRSFKSKIHWYYPSAAAIGLIFIVSAFFYVNNLRPSNEKLYNDYYHKYDANIVTRSEPTSQNDLITAIQLYDRGSYSEAISYFSRILNSDETNIAAHFFLGVTYMETNSFSKAIDHLRIVISRPDTIFLEQAEWYIALCYLRTNQTVLAIKILTKISNSKNFYKLLASDLIKKIKS